MAPARRRTTAMAAALAVLGLVLTQLPAAAVPPGWASPARVLRTPNQPRHSLVMDGNGKAHVAADDGSGIVYATNASGSWQSCRVSGGDDHEPSLALGAGKVHVAFARYDTGQRGIYTASGWGAGGADCGWDVVVRHAGTDGKPSIGAYGGTLHVAFRTSDHRLRYIRGTWDTEGWTVLETVDGSCCQSAPALALTSDGSPRIAYGDSSADGLKYAVRSGSSWDKRRVQRGRILHVALVLDQTPDPWHGNQPANAPSIAYVVKNAGTYKARKSGSGTSGAWSLRYFGRYFGPTDLATQSNKSVTICSQNGKIYVTSESGAIYVEKKVSNSGRDGFPQIGLYAGTSSFVTFARSGSGAGVYRTYGYL
jgi:hypothetical protein